MIGLDRWQGKNNSWRRKLFERGGRRGRKNRGEEGADGVQGGGVPSLLGQESRERTVPTSPTRNNVEFSNAELACFGVLCGAKFNIIWLLQKL